jgi:hypothetical protein
MAVTLLTYIIPVAVFLLSFIIIYAILAKTKLLGGNEFLQVIVSFLISILFVIVPPAQKYISLITPWFVVAIVSLFFLLLLGGFVAGKPSQMMSPALAWTFFSLLLIAFIVSAIQVLSPVLRPYLPGKTETGGTSFLLTLKHIVFYPSVFGTLLLLVIAMIVTWILIKAK